MRNNSAIEIAELMAEHLEGSGGKCPVGFAHLFQRQLNRERRGWRYKIKHFFRNRAARQKARG